MELAANTTTAADGLWLGLYQNDKGLGPAKGWGRCVGGDAPNFTNWHEGQPDAGYQQDCAFLALFGAGSGNGQWYNTACNSSMYSASLQASFSCM